MITILTPNESELEHLSGIEISDEQSRIAACRKLRESGCPVIINKAGEKGAYLCKDEILVNFGSHKVEAKDTTAAGDTLNAALAVALSQGNDLQYAIKYANAAASLSVTRQGAQSAMPGQQEVIRLMG
jgi:ribokinase